jgi:hypothetical protein
MICRCVSELGRALAFVIIDAGVVGLEFTNNCA